MSNPQRKHEPLLAPERWVKRFEEQFPNVGLVVSQTNKRMRDGELGEEMQLQGRRSRLMPAGVSAVAMLSLLISTPELVKKHKLNDRAALAEYAAAQDLVTGEMIVAYDGWRNCKQVYRFEPSFGDEIKNQPLTGAIPTAVFDHMPHPLIYVDCPIDVSEDDVALGFFAYVENFYPVPDKDDPASVGYVPNLVCLPVFPGTEIGNVQIRLDLPTISDAVRDIIDVEIENESLVRRTRYADAEGDFVADSEEAVKSAIVQYINLVMYVCSENADMQVGYVPGKATANPKKKNRRSGATVRDVGYRIAREIRAWRESASDAGDKTGATVAPHMRRAHWHHYWRGPMEGPRELILRWVPAVPVNFGEAEQIPTVHHRKA